MSNDCPIGVFDSGVGGLSVLKELIKVLPNENYLYFGDTLRVPYGEKSLDELLVCTRRILDFFKEKKVKLVLVACNTCSANTLDLVKDEYDFEILGLINPAAEYINKLALKKVGLIATTATVNSNAYPEALAKYGIKTIQQNCPQLVKLVESGDILSQNTCDILSKYLEPLKEKNIERLILGCTHYPFLIPAMKKLGYQDDFFINPAVCIAEEAKMFIAENDLSISQNKCNIEFFVSGDVAEFEKNANLFFGKISETKKALG